MLDTFDLSEKESIHISNLMSSRNGWQFAILKDRYYDEHYKIAVPHKYYDAHPYVKGMKEVLDAVIKFKPEKVLDIGSPVAQNLAVSKMTDLTILDIRSHPDTSLELNFMQGNAIDIPMEDSSVDMVTSMWTICHVGDGRYGDDLVFDADIRMLKEIHRILKQGCNALIGFGPLAETPALLFNAQRVYSWKRIAESVKDAGFELVEKKEFPIRADMFIGPGWNTGDMFPVVTKPGMYGYVFLRRA